jgi:hypothetical protein
MRPALPLRTIPGPRAEREFGVDYSASARVLGSIFRGGAAAIRARISRRISASVIADRQGSTADTNFARDPALCRIVAAVGREFARAVPIRQSCRPADIVAGHSGRAASSSRM